MVLTSLNTHSLSEKAGYPDTFSIREETLSRLHLAVQPYTYMHMKLTISQLPSSFVVCGGNVPLVSYPDNFLLSGCEDAVRE